MRYPTALSVLTLVAATLWSPAPAAAGSQSPNLVPLAPYNIHVGRADDGRESAAVRFSVTTLNVGEHALELLGAPPRDAERTAAQQCTGWVSRACVARRDAGDFIFHPAHGHWHFEGYGLYELRRLLPGGEPDLSDDPEAVVQSGGKISFCLLDTDRTDGAAGFPQDPFFYTGFYKGCLGAYQGISAGWGDTYTSNLPGQQILLDGVAPGRYAVVVTIDPDGRLTETDDTDNTSWQIVDYDGSGVSVV